MKRNAGFTLIEILVASLIFTVVMLTIYSAFHSGIFGYRDIEENINVYQQAKIILERINLDLRNAFIYSDGDAKFIGDNDSGVLSFFTTVDAYQAQGLASTYARVEYSMDGEKLMRRCLKNQESLSSTVVTKAQEMGSGIKIKFQYGYLPVPDQDVVFQDSWAKGPTPPDPEKKNLPVAVKVNLTITITNPQTQAKRSRDFERTIYLP